MYWIMVLGGIWNILQSGARDTREPVALSGVVDARVYRCCWGRRAGGAASSVITVATDTCTVRVVNQAYQRDTHCSAAFITFRIG
jgi:hypothetical protein